MSSKVYVRVESGILEGISYENDEDSSREYLSFQGIPYAKPPTAELRFKAPENVQPWDGIFKATRDGDQCFSRHLIHKNEKRGSEDCLTLNVYTSKVPIQTKNGLEYDLQPVMVYIHGGAFTHGCNSKMINNPEYLIRENVVVVVINYRLGILGFLSLDDPNLDVPGNAGFKDMVMALKWVNTNIKKFNGDPKNVTLFGESAGAASVHLLMLSPLAKGLFHKAIMQSGCALSVRARCKKLSTILSELIGIDGKNENELMKALKSMTAEEIHAIQEKIPDPFHASEIRPFGFVIEDSNQTGDVFLTREPLEIIRSGEYNQVPLLMGYNSREGMLIQSKSRNNIYEMITDRELNVPFHLNLKKGSPSSKKIAEKIFRFYFDKQTLKKGDMDNIYKLLSDNFFIRDLYRSAKLHAKYNLYPVYLYEMTIETSLNKFKASTGISLPGVCHGDDLCYLFKSPFKDHIEPESAEDIGIRRFCRLWTNFAKYGNPNSPNDDVLLPVEWKPFSSEKKHYYEIGLELSSKLNPIESRMKFWEKIYEPI